MPHFGTEIHSVKNIVKATPEAQYSCSMQRKWFKRTANFEKRQDFKMWQSNHFVKAIGRQNGVVFAFIFSFLKLRFCKRNETRLLSGITIN